MGKEEGKIYALEIRGSPTEQDRIFSEIRKMLEPYDGRVSYIVLPNGVTSLDFYLKKFAIERAIGALERIGVGTAKTGVSKAVEGLLNYVLETTKNQRTQS